MQTAIDIGGLTLASGVTLPTVRQYVTMYGKPRQGPVVLVAHAFSGNSEPAQWWPGIVGEGALFDPRQCCIVCINMLGSCYGSTGPLDVDPFPRLAMSDVVAAAARALDSLGIGVVDIVIGGSLGGMQALQWALQFPQRVRRSIIVGAADHQSALGIALSSLQRDAIALGGDAGVGLARKIAMLSYKSDALLALRHDRLPDRNHPSRFDVEGYLDHHAARFSGRMDAKTYVAISHLMDSFDVRHAPSAPEGAPPLDFIGIGNDWLFTPENVRASAERFAARGWNARYLHLESNHGHDAFLAESHVLAKLLSESGSIVES